MSIPKSIPHALKALTLATGLAMGVVGCGSDDSSEETSPQSSGVQLSGAVVKGPLANAAVYIYPLVLNQSGTAMSVDTSASDTGTTTAQAKLDGVVAPDSLAPPFIVEFVADASTIDLMTGEAPIMRVMRTVVTQEMLDNQAKIFGTPLTTMAIKAAIAKVNNDLAASVLTETEAKQRFLDYLYGTGSATTSVVSEVVSTVGFGMDTSTDIFTTAPLLDEDVDTAEEKQKTVEYRAAVEGLAAIANAIDDQSGGVSVDDVVDGLAADLADGSIDGTAGGLDMDVVNSVVAQDPSKLPVKYKDAAGNTVNGTLADIIDVVNAESDDIGTTTTVSTTEVTVALETAETNPDWDGDGTLNADDAFPYNAAETTDTDGDGMGNNADVDDDNDGVIDLEDEYPLDATQWTSNSTAADDADGDTVLDASDNCVNTFNTSQADLDGDGSGDACDTDADGDGTLNTADAFPLDAGETTDTDGDGVGNNADADDDNDGIDDVTETTNGTDPLLKDSDGDGVFDNFDQFPTDGTEWVDTDGDGSGNNADSDDDGDGLSDAIESGTGSFVDATDTGTKALVADTDGDGLLDGAEVSTGTSPLVDDTDGDTVLDALDNCPLTASTDQTDTDADGLGDPCDTDDDNDGVSDADEATQGSDPLLADTDSDSVWDLTDNCPVTSNAAQTDTDSDGEGDACDTDDDNDTVLDAADNCPLVANLDQADADGNGVGDACDVVNISGLWQLSGSVTSVVTVGTGVCDASVGAPVTLHVGAAQDASDVLTMHGEWGTHEPLATGGSVDTVNRIFSGTSGLLPSYDPLGTFDGNNRHTVNGTINADNTIDMTLVAEDLDTSATNGCEVTITLAGSKFNTLTGTENFSAVYGMEFIDETGERGSVPVQLLHSGSSVSIVLPEQNTASRYGSVTAGSFVPETGAIDFTWNTQEVGDFDGDGFDDLRVINRKFYGLLMHDPSDATQWSCASGEPCPPHTRMIIEHDEIEYSNVVVSALPHDTTGLTPSWMDRADINLYGKHLVSKGYTRNVHLAAIDKLNMGVLNPPVASSSGNLADLELNIMDGAAVLCNKPLLANLVQKGELPPADAALFAFNNSTYSYINCTVNDADVTDGNTYTARITDTKGTSADTTDDTWVEYPFIAAITTYPTVLPDIATTTFNGGVVNASGLVEGAFIPGASVFVGWNSVTGADGYIVEAYTNGATVAEDGVQETVRVTTDAATTSGVITVSHDQATSVRLRSVHNDANPEAKGFGISSWVNLQPGVYGNWDTYDAVGNFIETINFTTDATGSITCTSATFSPCSGFYNETTQQVEMNVVGPMGADTLYITLVAPNNGVQANWTSAIYGSGTTQLQGATLPAKPTFVGTAADAAALLAAGVAEPYTDNFWDGTQDVTEFWFWSVSYDGFTTTSVEEVWNDATGMFEVVTGNEDIYLSPTGWVIVDYSTDEQIIAASSTDAQLAMLDASGNQLSNLTLTFQTMDIGGEYMFHFVEPEWLARMKDPLARLSTGSQWVEITVTQNQDSYQLGYWTECDPVDLTAYNGNCNTAWLRSYDPVTGDLNMHTAAVALTDFLGVANQTIELGYGGSMSLVAMFKADSTLSFYTVDWSLGMGATDTGVTGGTWSSYTDGASGVEIINYTIPTSLRDQFNVHYDWEEAQTGFLSVHNGFVRHGSKHTAGVTSDVFYLHDAATGAEIKANFQ